MFNEVPILMYHRVDRVSTDRNTVPIDKFAWQLQYLHDNGYHSITLSDLYCHLVEKTVLPSKPIVLTFDDGYVDNYENVLPLLKKYNMVATVFVVAGWVGRECGWRKKNKQNTTLMTWEQLRDWHHSGMEIGAHTVNHLKLSTLSEPEIEDELTKSKLLLEQNLGFNIDFLCYPYGDFDDRVKDCAERTGYKAALAIHEGTSLVTNELFALRRVGISSRLGQFGFKLKVSPIHTMFIGLRNLETKLKKYIES